MKTSKKETFLELQEVLVKRCESSACWQHKDEDAAGASLGTSLPEMWEGVYPFHLQAAFVVVPPFCSAAWLLSDPLHLRS